MREIIVINGQPKTQEIKKCDYNSTSHKWDVVFKNSNKTYSYGYEKVIRLKDSTVINSDSLAIYRGDHLISYAACLIERYNGNNASFYRITDRNGNVQEYSARDIRIEKSCLISKKQTDILKYLKELSGINSLVNDKGEKLLEKQFSQVSFISEHTALAKYVTGKNGINNGAGSNPIFPFGCNHSQYEAVYNALENNISIIEGPPGTGKTQTILNIIANLLIRNKNVQVVSNNNSAIENVLEKLGEHNLGFVIALLGKADNKEDFISNQSGEYPEFDTWIYKDDTTDLFNRITDLSESAGKLFKANEELAGLRKEFTDLNVEQKYHDEMLSERSERPLELKIRRNVSAANILKLRLEWIDATRTKGINFIFKFKAFFRFGLTDKQVFESDLEKITDALQELYYIRRKEEVEKRIEELERIVNKNSSTLDDLTTLSMAYLKHVLAKRYGTQSRRVFDSSDFWKNPNDFIKEYPVVLSTTFSAKNTLGSNLCPITYDYLIMDEASQVDVVTGALALYSARNAVIVGDRKQLPNVVTPEDEAKAQAITVSYDIPDGYSFTNSFMASVQNVISEVPTVLLKEHYRCHPKIIDYCNQKYYKGQLMIMTKDSGENNVLNAVVTVEGNHARGHYNQRQIEVIRDEILNDIDCPLDRIGIIAPYRDQVAEMRKELPSEISIDTVHKFQGREKDVIILSTVDNEKNEFLDNPYLINVAISRAKKRLYVVTSAEVAKQSGNVGDLIGYIKYNNFEVVESKIYSVFDNLYSQYTNEVNNYLKGRKKISEYDSENLMYALLEDIINEQEYNELKVLCHVSLRDILKDTSLLSNAEKRYALNSHTHIDFSVINRVNKKYVLAIEVDGYIYHKEGTDQAERDIMKNHICDVYGIPLLRLSTIGSSEKEAIVGKLKELL